MLVLYLWLFENIYHEELHPLRCCTDILCEPRYVSSDQCYFMSVDRSREVLSCTFTLPESSFGESFMDCRLLSGRQGTVKKLSVIIINQLCHYHSKTCLYSLHRYMTTEKALQKRRRTTLNSGTLEDLLAVPAVLKALELCFTIL